jgi:Flp pilus assembly protein TadG
MTGSRGASLLRRFYRATDGSNAIEFAILAMPFILLLVGIVQIGIYFVCQAALDLGVARTAESMRMDLVTTTPSFPNAATLRSNVVASSGALISNTSSLEVEIQPVANLTSTAKAIVNGTNDYGSDSGHRDILALRATFVVPSFLPGVPTWKVASSALVRRVGR